MIFLGRKIQAESLQSPRFSLTPTFCMIYDFNLFTIALITSILCIMSHYGSFGARTLPKVFKTQAGFPIDQAA
jgi:hypothetical protein